MVMEFNRLNDDFVLWFKNKQGTVNENIAIADYSSQNGGRGIKAIADIKKDQVLFTIPRTLLLSITSSTLGQKVDISSLEGWGPLILTLMYECSREDSSWKEYLALLPKSFTTPMFWSPNELAELKGTSIQEKLGKEEAEKTYYEILLPIIDSHPEVFPKEQCNVEAFHRIGSLIMAYSFNVENEANNDDADDSEQDEDPLSIAMVPFADLLNANETLNNARLFYEKDQLKMVAIKDINKGDQIYNTYGPLPSSDLLRRYGYLESMIVDDYPMPHDIVEIDARLIVDVIGKEDSTQQKIDYMLDEGVLEDSFILEMGEIPPELVVTIATLQLPAEEFQKYRKKGKLPKPNLTEDVAKALEKVLLSRVAAYPSTLERDEQGFSESSSFAHQAALLVRISEQRILHEALRNITSEARPLKRVKT